ncbi:MAG TPA: 3-hydroxyacyl-CoA dehydrogenase NAD-binding domain-containing protein, partial [Allocoleopsis sp.]
MFKPLRTAAVLGAGVMGTQIAAHLANAGMIVYLLDIPAKTGNKNDLVEAAFKKGLKQSPPIFFTEKTARRVILGNFDEDFDRLSQVDWIIEAVIENLEVKQQLMQRLKGVISGDAIVSTNTSGLPIHAIAQAQSESLRRRFLGTHFFNPPRYLKLLELIPTDDTDPAVVERMRWFGESHLGKGVVIAKDTPNFIANRIGMYATMLGLKAWTEQGYTIEEIDRLTGTIMGRPKSATFRTADLVGLDTLLYVTENLYPAIPEDESRDMFRVPEVLRQLVATGTLGAKSGQGFYKKQAGQILSLNRDTLTYEPAQPMNLGEIETIEKLPLPERIRTLYEDTGRAGALFRPMMLQILGYSARRIPEITDSPTEIDRAMRWGFGWEVAPFEIWQILGKERVLADMQVAGIGVPDWVSHWIQDNQMQDNETQNSQEKTASLSLQANSKSVIWQNSEAALLDMGDGVVQYEFRSKGNTLSSKVMAGFSTVLDLLETEDFKGLVIGNDSPHFSGGANLAEMAMMAQAGGVGVIKEVIEQF